MRKDKTYIEYKAGSSEIIAKIAEDNRDWAMSIAKSVARAWNLNWQTDGLDGGAYEALLFCAKRFDPTLGVPFRAYARRRIHEACTAEARESKDWQFDVAAHSKSGVVNLTESNMITGANHQGGANSTESVPGSVSIIAGNEEVVHEEREVSMKLFDIYPELREGMVLKTEEGSDDVNMRNAVRMLLASASLLSLLHESQEANNPDKALEASQVTSLLSELSSVHQNLLWDLYWHDYSLRALAEKWGVDELVIIREHQSLVEHLSKRLKSPVSSGKRPRKSELKVRPTLRPFAEKFKEAGREFPFRDKV